MASRDRWARIEDPTFEDKEHTMKTLEHVTEIDAAPEQVWAVLTDFAAYPEWNPFLTIEAPRTEPGDKLAVTFRAGTRKPVTMHPTVTEFVVGSRLSWLGRLGVPRVFDGAHRFEVEAMDGGRTRFTQSETFRGVLVPFLGRLLRDTDGAFAAMNVALKARAEQISASVP
jgi:hypothetical protein